MAIIRRITRSPDNVIKPAGLVVPKTPAFLMPDTEASAVVKQIREAFGENVARLGSNMGHEAPRLRTGRLALDLALAGGFLMSRGSMLYGERSSGKTTNAMMAVISAQRMFPNHAAAWIDLEGSFDRMYFTKLGGDLDRLLIVEPETGEHAVDLADALARTKEISIIVTDSIAMLVPMKELEASAEDQHMGLHARLIGNYLRRLNNAMLKERHRDHNPLILHINQFRMKIGLVFGDPRTLPGGKALEFCTSQQVEMKNKEEIDEKTGDIKWNEHNFKITKDKTGGRIRAGKYKFVRDPEYNNGLPETYIDQTGTIIDMATRLGWVEGQLGIKGFGKQAGKDRWREYFFKEPEAFVRIQDEIIHAFRVRWGLEV